jgi:hypothetical protein
MYYKRFLLFAGDWYYPTAFWGDFQDSYDTLDEAIEAWDENQKGEYGQHDWGYIVDLETGQNRGLDNTHDV